jgi:hypothetical protein
MSEKNYKIIKTIPGTVLFTIHPISNPMLSRRVALTEKSPVQPLPLDWALGVFADQDIYALYKKHAFTFDDNSIVEEAFNAGVYFDDKLDFTPAKPDQEQYIFGILKSGNRQAIMDLIDSKGAEIVKRVAIAKTDDLTQSVVRMLENIFRIQLTVDGE